MGEPVGVGSALDATVLTGPPEDTSGGAVTDEDVNGDGLDE